MKMRIPLSAAANRTSPPSISRLMRTALENPGIISLAAGFVDQRSLPVAITRRSTTELLTSDDVARKALQYGTTAGDRGLRHRLIDGLERGDGVPVGSYGDAIHRTVVTTGSAQLIYLICEALLDPGDIVLVEWPTYFVFLGPIETRGARAIGIPIDDHGMRLDALDATLERLDEIGELDRVKLIYTIPEHANPTGISLAAERRKPLLDLARKWSREQRIFVLEDAAYRGLSFDGHEPPTVFSHDRPGDTVILARTFSKTFSPGLKIGYGVLPQSLVEPILYLKGNHDFGSANFNQCLLETVLADGTYDEHVSRLRGVYRRKRDLFLAALDEHLGALKPEVEWTRPNGGLFVWLTVPSDLDTGFDGPLFPRCVEEGVIYVPGEHAFAPEPDAPPRNHLRLTFGVPSEADLVEGSRRLASALSACLNLVS